MLSRSRKLASALTTSITTSRLVDGWNTNVDRFDVRAPRFFNRRIWIGEHECEVVSLEIRFTGRIPDTTVLLVTEVEVNV